MMQAHSTRQQELFDGNRGVQMVYKAKVSNPMERKPVAGMVRTESSGVRVLVVVCDDGSVWSSNDLTGEWQERKSIPGTPRYTEIDPGAQAAKAAREQEILQAAQKQAAEHAARRRR
jgi:hypothetical protein